MRLNREKISSAQSSGQVIESSNPLPSSKYLQNYFFNELLFCNMIFCKRVTLFFDQQIPYKPQFICSRPQEINFLTSEKQFSFISFLRWFYFVLILYCRKSTKGKTIYEWQLLKQQQRYFLLPSGFSSSYKLYSRQTSSRIKLNKSFVDLQKKI